MIYVTRATDSTKHAQKPTRICTIHKYETRTKANTKHEQKPMRSVRKKTIWNTHRNEHETHKKKYETRAQANTKHTEKTARINRKIQPQSCVTSNTKLCKVNTKHAWKTMRERTTHKLELNFSQINFWTFLLRKTHRISKVRAINRYRKLLTKQIFTSKNSVKTWAQKNLVPRGHDW